MDKLKSRKLWAFLVWTILMAASFFAPKIPPGELIQMYGFITGIYIGGQSAIDFIKEKK